MKTIYILLTRSGTLLSNLVYAVTGANYTHASLRFDSELPEYFTHFLATLRRGTV